MARRRLGERCAAYVRDRGHRPAGTGANRSPPSGYGRAATGGGCTVARPDPIGALSWRRPEDEVGQPQGELREERDHHQPEEQRDHERQGRAQHALGRDVGDARGDEPTDPEDRLVIFTERIATLNWLRARLTEDLSLKPGQVETLHGGMSDVDQQRVVEDFGNTQRPVRLLICSDVASEGINLRYQCHRLIHFDMPWSLMVFQQRNGRVDRYGQNATPQIVYLVTRSANPTIRGDTRILEVLMKKDEQAYKNIGDPSVFMGVHDIEMEEDITREAVARGESDADFDERWTPKPNQGESLLTMFLQPKSDQAPARPTAVPPHPFSLFGSELDYCEAALHRLRTARSENGGAGGSPLSWPACASWSTRRPRC